MNRTKLLLFLLLTLANEFSNVSAKLQLTVYYESKCPDSRSFMLRQLRPAMLRLHEHVKTQFVPFGKAMSIDFGFGGFECQHGQQECYGNMLQDCTLHLMQERSDLDKVNYVVCEMANMKSNGFECVLRSGIDPEKVQHCIEFGKGTMLQIDSEYKTNQVAPTFIPTITINMVFDKDIQRAAITDLYATLCLYLKSTKACMDYYNRQALRYIFNETI